MSVSTEGEEKHSIEGNDEEDLGHPARSDDEDDCEGFFLEPVGTNVNIAEKIAEANKKLLEEDDKNDSRPRKVKFSEEVVNFEPDYYSDDDYTESALNSVISEEDLELKSNPEDVKIEEEIEKSLEREKEEEDIPEEIDELDGGVASPRKDAMGDLNEINPNFILVLLSKEHNSSCESIIGEEISKDKSQTCDKIKPEPEKPVRVKIARPKSAKKFCDVPKISPNLSYSSNVERKSWQTSRNPLIKRKTKADPSEKKDVFVGEIQVQMKGRVLKKINVDNVSLEKVSNCGKLVKCDANRPRSCHVEKNNGRGDNRPKTAPMRRTCCVIRTELPQYNGLRSEYGLSAEQLQERKQKALENKQKKKQEEMKKQQEEIRKRNESEETFQRWLISKAKKNLKNKSLKLTDTLTRSDVYIQTHASYAANRNVPYCLDFSISKKNYRKREAGKGKRIRTINLEKILGNMTPHFKRSFNIYLGVKP